MPYLAVELDALKQVPRIAMALGVEPGPIGWGLLQLWAYVFETKSDLVGEMALDGCFGPNQRIRVALKEFGFIEQLEVGFRVRGAERYLRIKKAQSDAGKASSGNLKQNTGSPGDANKDLPAHLPAKPDDLTGYTRSLKPALTPSTKHQAPIEETTTLSAEPTGGPADLVFEHWRTVLAKNSRTAFDAKRKGAVKARLKDGYTVEDLKRAIDGCSKTPHNQGNNDRGEKFDDLELICRNASNVDRFKRNAEHPPSPNSKGRATEADKDWDNFDQEAWAASNG